MYVDKISGAQADGAFTASACVRATIPKSSLVAPYQHSRRLRRRTDAFLTTASSSPRMFRSSAHLKCLPSLFFSRSVSSCSIASSSSLSSASSSRAHTAPSPVFKHVPIPSRGVDFRGKVVLAPMVRAGELPSRLVALKYGADLVWSPEIVDKALLGCVRKVDAVTQTVDFVKPSNHDHHEMNVFRVHSSEKNKLICQLGTACPLLAVQAANMVARDVSGIDVNAGCPLPFSTLGGMGAALLQTPSIFISILEALVNKVGKPHNIGISTKIRILENPLHTETLVKRLLATGITGLSVHCRTSAMRANERAIRTQLHMIGDICRSEGVACLMNGDIESRDEALRLAQEYGVDGGMIAAAAQNNLSV